MKNKPIGPIEHAIIDCVFSAVQLVAPKGIGLDENTIKIYQALGTGFLAINALTDTPLAVKPVISFEDHKKADIGFLAGLSLLTFSKPIRSNKRDLCFHLSFLSMAVGNYFLTNYESEAGTKAYIRRIF